MVRHLVLASFTLFSWRLSARCSSEEMKRWINQGVSQPVLVLLLKVPVFFFHRKDPHCLLPVTQSSNLETEWKGKGETKDRDTAHTAQPFCPVSPGLHSYFPEDEPYPFHTFFTCLPFLTGRKIREKR